MDSAEATEVVQPAVRRFLPLSVHRNMETSPAADHESDTVRQADARIFLFACSCRNNNPHHSPHLM